MHPTWCRTVIETIAIIIGLLLFIAVQFLIGCIVLSVLRLLGRLLRSSEPGPGCCAECGYDLRASHGRCPECGAAIPANLHRPPIR